jgi:hypothetical protein
MWVTRPLQHQFNKWHHTKALKKGFAFVYNVDVELLLLE